jgi:glycosyltransferase involved in cell wall biosynthesis
MMTALPGCGVSMERRPDKNPQSAEDIIALPRTDKPLVSIVTPSYNQGQFIEATLLSVKNQDYPHIEHLVIDGGSSDNTVEILKKHEREYNLKWISEPDKGQSDAVNKGFERADGQIIGWLNSDDVYVDRHVISCVVDKFEEFNDADVIYGDGIDIGENNLVLKVIHNIPWFSFNRLVRFDFIIQPSCFFKREIVKQHKLDTKIDLPMDYEYYLRLAAQGFKFKHVNRVLAATRWHEEAKSMSRAEEVRVEAKKVKDLYGRRRSLSYYLGFVFDDIVILLLKAYGLRTMMVLRANSGKHNLAFSAKFDSLPRAMFRQLSFNPRRVFG